MTMGAWLQMVPLTTSPQLFQLTGPAYSTINRIRHHSVSKQLYAVLEGQVMWISDQNNQFWFLMPIASKSCSPVLAWIHPFWGRQVQPAFLLKSSRQRHSLHWHWPHQNLTVRTMIKVFVLFGNTASWLGNHPIGHHHAMIGQTTRTDIYQV